MAPRAVTGTGSAAVITDDMFMYRLKNLAKFRTRFGSVISAAFSRSISASLAMPACYLTAQCPAVYHGFYRRSHRNEISPVDTLLSRNITQQTLPDPDIG